MMVTLAEMLKSSISMCRAEMWSECWMVVKALLVGPTALIDSYRLVCTVLGLCPPPSEAEYCQGYCGSTATGTESCVTTTMN
jgi:hypothetical protein